MTASHSCSVMDWKDLSRRIPALAINTWTPPNFSRATATIFSPSSAEHTAAAALPPAIHAIRSNVKGLRVKHTLGDLIHNGVGTLFRDIVDDNVRAETRIHEGVCASKTSTSTGDDDSLTVEADLGSGLSIRRELASSLKFALQQVISSMHMYRE